MAQQTEAERKAAAEKARETARKAAEASGAEAQKTQGQDGRSAEEQAIGARQEPDDLARDTAAMQGRGGLEGLEPGEPKDTMLASPGAQFDPAAVARTPGTGITSAPLGQPARRRSARCPACLTPTSLRTARAPSGGATSARAR